MLKKLIDDYQRHGSNLLNPGFWAICHYRFGRWTLNLRLAPLRWVASKLYGFNCFFLLILSGTEINREAVLGKELHLVHGTNIHIHPNTIIGDRCGIMHDVTIGTNMEPGAPTIGNDVFIGAGAKILGNVNIGDKVIVASNSLVTTNVPSDRIAIGIPARSIKKRQPPLQKQKKSN